jgi:hypothetical protein
LPRSFIPRDRQRAQQLDLVVLRRELHRLTEVVVRLDDLPLTQELHPEQAIHVGQEALEVGLAVGRQRARVLG